MVRRLKADEAALWRKVVESVRPLPGTGRLSSSPAPESDGRPTVTAASRPPATSAQPSPIPRAAGSTLDGGWDRRLSRGLVQPDLSLDLHGHNLATAYDLLDRKLEQAIVTGARLILLITGKPPSDKTGKRGAIRAAIGDWLAASRHAGQIAAVRNAHPRHGGNGALYIVIRRRRREPNG